MASGGCLCGNVKLSFTGKPAAKVSISGTPKEYTKKADSGKDITNFFCDNCGVTVWREAMAMPGLRIIKIGVLDNALEANKPDVELFASRRIGWVPKIDGTEDKQEMS